MAIVIMGGLFVATFLTLLFLPALYALWFRKSLGAHAPQAARTTGEAPTDVGILAKAPTDVGLVGAPAE